MPLLLFTQSTLTFNRDAGDGYWQGGKWIDSATTTFDAQGNLQPYRMGDSQQTLPEGLKAEDVLIFRTQTAINTVNQFSFETADTTTIDGLEYIALNSANWNRFPSLSLNHYEVMLIRKDKAPNGSL